MGKRLTILAASISLIGCGASNVSNSKTASDAPQASDSEESRHIGGGSKKPSAMSDWSEVPATESKPSAVSARNSQVVVTSHPTKHGEALHFRFVVNSVPISGVFSAPGGQTSTFTIPVGTVHFTVDECEGDTQGFELSPDENMPIKCEMTTEGDCCEVAIPVEPKSKKQR